MQVLPTVHCNDDSGKKDCWDLFFEQIAQSHLKKSSFTILPRIKGTFQNRIGNLNHDFQSTFIPQNFIKLFLLILRPVMG